MTSIRDILGFLEQLDEVGCMSLPQMAGDFGTEINGVCQDNAAGAGDLSWLSPSQASLFPERVLTYLGTLLICPPSIERNLWEREYVVVCQRPKLAFIRIFNAFFSHLGDTQWFSDPFSVVEAAVVHGGMISLGPGVVLGSGVKFLGEATVGPGSVIANCTIGRGVAIGANCAIGLPGFGFEKDPKGVYWRFPHVGGVIIEESVEIGSNTCIDRGALGDTFIGKGTKIDNLVHIAHNVAIGANSLVIANSLLGGSAQVGEDVWVAPSVTVMNQLRVGDSAFLGLGAVVIRDVPPAVVVVGNPAKQLRKRD